MKGKEKGEIVLISLSISLSLSPSRSPPPPSLSLPEQRDRLLNYLSSFSVSDNDIRIAHRIFSEEGVTADRIKKGTVTKGEMQKMKIPASVESAIAESVSVPSSSPLSSVCVYIYFFEVMRNFLDYQAVISNYTNLFRVSS